MHVNHSYIILLKLAFFSPEIYSTLKNADKNCILNYSFQFFLTFIEILKVFLITIVIIITIINIVTAKLARPN